MITKMSMNQTKCKKFLKNIGKSYENYFEHCLKVMPYHYVLHVVIDGLVPEQLTDWIEKLAAEVTSNQESKKPCYYWKH